MTRPFVAIGEIFQDRYEVLSVIGEGGFGSVYQARQIATEQLVAIKVLRLQDKRDAPQLSQQAARFRREAELCSQLYHPNIVRLIDSGQDGDRLIYTVFEFVPGKTLADTLAREGPLAVRETIYLMTQVLDALACAHKAKVLHRDLKPHNIMLTDTGLRRNAMMLDFGIGTFAEASADAHRLTRTGQGLGTPAYASPEQLKGKPSSWRSDLYSWALVFVECISGQRVMQGGLSEVIQKQLSDNEIELPAAVAALPFASLIRLALSKDHIRRNVTIQVLFRELLDFEQGWGGLDATPIARPATASAGHSMINSITPGAIVDNGDTHMGISTGDTAAGGEHRQLTMVSCGMGIRRGDSTQTLLDIEEHDHLLQRTRTICHEIVRNHGGYYANTIGDRVLYYFGMPYSRQDDALRAVTAALDILTALSGEEVGDSGGARGGNDTVMDDPLPLMDIRIGVHTDLVIERPNPFGSTDWVLGILPNVAIGLDSVVEESAVVISETTRHLVRRKFHEESLGEHELAGIHTPINVFQVKKWSMDTLTPVGLGQGFSGVMIGRERELELLENRWRLAGNGQGQAVLIVGEPGIGKSRLAQELHYSIVGDEFRWLECRCSPESQNSALRPIVELLESMLDTIGDRTLVSLRMLLMQYGFEDDEVVALLVDLIDIDLGDVALPSLNFSPQHKKERTLDALISLLFEMSEQERILMFIEDIHWADPTTLDLLSQLVADIGGERICLVMTARPEFQPPWRRTAEVAQVSLTRLERPRIVEIVRNVTGEKPIPEQLLQHIIDRTDGVPLYVEEFTRMLIETNAMKEGENEFRLTGSISDLSIPNTLRGSLMERLDGLGRAKETVQLAAVLGREFTFDILAAVSPYDEETLEEHLHVLVGAHILNKRRRIRQRKYVFRHALMCDTAYALPLKSVRAQMHANIADVVEEQFPDLAQSRPELLARHYMAADKRLEALPYATSAAATAQRRYANREAIFHAKMALDCLDAVTPEPVREEVELEINSILIPALFTVEGSANHELIKHVARSLTLKDQRGDDANIMPVLWMLCMHHHTRGQRADARMLAERLVNTSRRSGDATQLAPSLGLQGQCFWIDGNFSAARPILEQALRLYDPERHRPMRFTVGFDPKIQAQVTLAEVLWCMGYPDRALAYNLEAVEWAENTNHPTNIALARNFLSMMYQHRGEKEASMREAERAIELGREYHFKAQMAYGRLLYSAVSGDYDGLMQAIEFSERADFRMGVSYYRFLAAEIEYANRNFDNALALLKKAAQGGEESGEYYWLSEIYRFMGVIKAESGELSEGEAYMRRAVMLARERAAKLLELKAVTSLGELLCEMQRGHEIRSALSELWDWFMEGFDTEAMVAAKELRAKITS